jgi:glycosyltransferase involved in cell wall biosynthesis
MKLFAHCHTYGRTAKQGADAFMRSILEYLVTRDCEVTIGIDEAPEYSYWLNGVLVISNKNLLGEHYEAADAIITNIEFNHPSLTIAKRFNKPVFQIAHNAENKTFQPYIIYNSICLRDTMQMPYDNIVVNPVTYLKDWENDIDHFNQPYITLVNCCPNKGAEILYSLATWLPQHKFQGIYGGYGNQMSKGAVNLTYKPFTLPISYDNTRILIVPSKKESWSLCASEAMASGIPVVCADLPGLHENCGNAAIYCNTLRDYVDAIGWLSEEITYNKMAEAGKKRIAERNHGQQLDNLYNFIADKVNKDFNLLTGSQETISAYEQSVADIFEKEKIEVKPEKEKREIKPKHEKKIVRR